VVKYELTPEELLALTDVMGLRRFKAKLKQIVDKEYGAPADGRLKWTSNHVMVVHLTIEVTKHRRNESTRKAIKHLMRPNPWRIAGRLIRSEKRAREIYLQGTKLLQQWKAEGNDSYEYAMRLLEEAKASNGPGPFVLLDD
jgi:hypothetical protein